MKQFLYCAAVFSLVFVFSCREKPATRPTFSNQPFTLPSGSGSATPAKNVLPGNNIPVANNNSGGGMINPAHGQPGHRCDIAVGATIPATPFAAKAAGPVPVIANPALQTTPAAAQTTNPVAPAALASATGLNPAHGQPGHRCDIAVGAPLNSKPAQTAKPATTASPVVKPVLQPDTLFAKGLNPAHGQPGHRCDIAVGQPLNAAKKKDSTVSTANPG